MMPFELKPAEGEERVMQVCAGAALQAEGRASAQALGQESAADFLELQGGQYENRAGSAHFCKGPDSHIFSAESYTVFTTTTQLRHQPLPRESCHTHEASSLTLF